MKKKPEIYKSKIIASGKIEREKRSKEQGVRRRNRERERKNKRE